MECKVIRGDSRSCQGKGISKSRGEFVCQKREREQVRNIKSVNNYLEKFGSSKNKLKDPNVLQSNFLNLSKAVKGDEAAAEIVSIWPEILCVPQKG